MPADVLVTRKVGLRRWQRSFVAMTIVATGIGGERVATAGPNDAYVYANANYVAPSCLLSIGTYPTPANFSCVPNDSISSLLVGSGVRIELGENANFVGRQAYFDGGHAYPTLPRGANDMTSAISIFPRLGGAMAAYYMADFPHGSTVYWSQDVDGMAHSSTYWYFTQTTSISKFPLTTRIDQAPDPGSDNNNTNPNRHGFDQVLKDAGYVHMGDPDFAPRASRCSSGSSCYDVLIVPLQGSGKPPAVAFYRPTDLSLMGWSVVPSLGGPGPAGMVAYRSTDDHIYLTDGGPTSLLYNYSVDWQSLFLYGTPNLASGGTFLPVDRNYNPTSYSNGQGAVFDPTGNLFYVCGGDPGASGNKIVVFAISGGFAVLQAHSENNWGAFTYPIDFEPEGLDYLDTTTTSIPGFPSSQLHAVVLHDGVFHDDATMYHYSY